MPATAAEGHGQDLDDPEAKANKMDAVTSSLSRSDIHDLLSNACANLTEAETTTEESGTIPQRPNQSLAEATSTAASVLVLQSGDSLSMDVDVKSSKRAAKRCIPFCKESKASKAVA